MSNDNNYKKDDSDYNHEDNNNNAFENGSYPMFFLLHVLTRRFSGSVASS